MRAWRDGVFLLGFSLLLTHELDAVGRGEWRLLPVLSSLDDDTGRTVFVLLHVPLFALLIGLCWAQAPALRRWSRIVVSAFLVTHVGLHALFVDHPRYDFHEPLSVGLIYGAGLMGLAYFVLAMAARR